MSDRCGRYAPPIRSLRYSLNVSLDGYVDHAAEGFLVDAELHDHAAVGIVAVDGIILGRPTYELMEFRRHPPADLPAGLLPSVRKLKASSAVRWRSSA